MADVNPALPAGFGVTPGAGHLVTEPFNGSPGGSNLALPQQSLDDSEARYIQDALVDYPGLTRRRGPVRKVTGIATLTRKGTGLVMTLNPQGIDRYGVLNGDVSNGFFSVLGDDLTAVAADLAWPHPLPATPPSAPYRIVDAKPGLNGGVFIGVSSGYDANAPNQGLAYWMGANKANYSAASITVARGSANVTAPSGFNANVSPGMWLFATTDEGTLGTVTVTIASPGVFTLNNHGLRAGDAVYITTTGALPTGLTPSTTYYVISAGLTVNNFELATTPGGAAINTSGTQSGTHTLHLRAYDSPLIGLVKSVNSDTSITLDQVSPYTITAQAATFQALRGFAPKVVTGLITVDTSGTQVVGGKTKFLSQALDVGIWALYRAKDMAFIGKVSAVQSEFALTLAANAAVAMAEESYIAIRADADYSIVTTANTRKVGFLNATYAGRQWYGNNGASQEKTARIWFSDANDPEAEDLSDFDGDWDDITSSATVNEAIRALGPANSGLLVFKENETFIITGSSPSSFSPKKIEDDGALSGMSVQQYGGGVIWAGREGIHFFDGIQAQNLTADKLGDYWKNTVRTFDPTKYRMWSMVNRDHYFLFIENIAPTVPIIKGTTSTTPTRYTVVINLATKAVTFLTNVNIRGAVTLPASAGKHTWYLVNGQTAGDVTSTQNVGKTAIGGTLTTSLSADRKRGSKFTLPQGTLKSLSVYFNPSANVGATQPWKLEVYADSGGSPGALIAASNERVMNQSDPAGWYTLSLPSDVPISGGDYWLQLHTGVNNGTNPGGYAYDVVVGADLEGLDTYSDGPSNPYGAIAQTQDRQLSIYTTLALDHAFIAEGEALFNEEGVDPITSDGGPAGPDFFFESKKFDAGDPTRLKKFKQLMLHYLVQGGSIKVDVVMGLNNVGNTLTGEFPASVWTWDTLRTNVATWDAVRNQFATWSQLVQGVYVPKRVKFQKGSQHLSFRLWQSSAVVSRLQIGPYHIGYKLKRPGRV